jgi:hypothetical protein
MVFVVIYPFAFLILLIWVFSLLVLVRFARDLSKADSRYAFATLRIHGVIYKERGLLTSEGKEIKNSQQILQLLEAV